METDTKIPVNANVAPREFRYIADPVCLGAICLYCLNRWCLKPHHIGGWFTYGYLNDLLCLPLFLPIILWIQSVFRIRKHNGPPSLFEVIHNWIVFSVIFELVLPRISIFNTTSDPWDVVAYLVGGLLAYGFWAWRDTGCFLKFKCPSD